MSAYTIRALLPDDADLVLQFELAHKSFFEQKIDARANEFYQLEAVQQHIADFLLLKQQLLAWPALVFNAAEELIGRANIKDINQSQQSAYVGYRIAEDWSGKGVASFALEQLIQQAKQMELKTLYACVSAENPASERVLQKAGFRQIKQIPQVAIVQDKAVSGYLLQLDI
ncbi:acetyltransferase, ribosomal protein N-acetylase [Rheinheimera sp. A13L]|uniref:GNAT family N-acetyltransferase n=1 Tax=Rheinheimera sp. A13L TaxID=506534 RepID=UPI000212556F|nr:GNAT family N-acetyltransferase [Rheinheimera sp. A13L]EGM77808.1 acetyltransferase, ribosomal protein N-acetylase [Rheinheimera sp. A13L]